MADAGDVSAGDTILEIGPGTGVLTKELLKRGARVIAIEADARSVDLLNETFASEIACGALTLRHGDIRNVPLTELGLTNGTFTVVSNIPYYLSGVLFRTLLSGETKPKTLVFLVQKEVAERITRSEKESLLSLSVKAYGEPTYIGTVKRGNFSPAPHVDSAIIAVHNIGSGRMKGIDKDFFFEILHLGLGKKRKQLLGNLSALFPRESLEAVFQTLDIPLNTRGEDLPLEIWLSLAKKLDEIKRV